MSALLKMSPDALEACKVEEPPEEQMLDAIIVVHAATDPMPSNLMAAIRNAAQPNEMDKTGIFFHLDPFHKMFAMQFITELCLKMILAKSVTHNPTILMLFCCVKHFILIGS